jgi:hypothetical protein
MDGTQIGLINFGGAMRGKQFGLINFFQKSGSKEAVRMGTPAGLLNLGSSGSYLRLYYNELFSTNMEYTTGNCMNCTYTSSTMPYWDDNKILNQNALIIGYDHWRKNWGFGYGFQKLLYNKSSMLPTDPNNEKRMITYGLRFIHLNRTLSLDKSFNLVTRANFDWGKRYRSIYWYLGVSANYFITEDNNDQESFLVQSFKISSGKLLGLNTEFWPGYNVGIQF